jgi:hypothetical protein
MEEGCYRKNLHPRREARRELRGCPVPGSAQPDRGRAGGLRLAEEGSGVSLVQGGIRKILILFQDYFRTCFGQMGLCYTTAAAAGQSEPPEDLDNMVSRNVAPFKAI